MSTTVHSRDATLPPSPAHHAPGSPPGRATNSKARSRTKQPGRINRLGLSLAIAGTAAAAAVAGWSVLSKVGGSAQPLVYYTLARRDLPIVLTERGNLESQQQTTIFCEVESVSYDRGSGGTQIIWIVPNGTSVRQGDLLVELDSAPLKSLLENQILAHERANAEKIQADAKYENQITQNVTLEAEAQLKLELADLDLKMYGDQEDGTYQILLQELNLKIRDARNLIAEAQAKLAMSKTDRDGIEMLHEMGYRGKGDLDQVLFQYLQAEDSMEKALNTLANAVSSRKKLEQYENPMKMKELTGALATARRNLEQVKVDNVSLLAQVEASRNAAHRSLETEKEKLDKYTSLLEKCKIYAPHDGLAVYAVEDARRGGGGSTIAEGALVRERQAILTLPNLASMQVKTSVHESVLDHVRPGLPVTIKIDAVANRTYRGSVQTVGVLPQQGNWLSSDVKLYETIVTIDEPVERLKPGMTAVVEIHVDRLRDVLSVPVQAVVQVEDDSWCYVKSGRDVKRKPVKLGRTNDTFVEIVDGMPEGVQVVLNPTAVIDEAQHAERLIAPDAGHPEAEVPVGPQTVAAAGAAPSTLAGAAVGAAPEAPAKPEPPAAVPTGQGFPQFAGGERPGAGEGKGRGRGQFSLMSFDQDGDGKVSRQELPERMQAGFERFDRDQSGFIEAAEATPSGPRRGGRGPRGPGGAPAGETAGGR